MSFGKRRPGDWMCPTCNFLIWASKSSCNKCGTVNPNRNFGGGRGRPGDWMCTTCNFLIWGSKSSCNKCGAQRPKGNNANSTNTTYQDWTCVSCHTSNFPDRVRCRSCNRDRNHKASDQKQNPSHKSKQKFKYLVVLDFEATCEENTRINPQEIIEWPAMIIDTATNTILKKETFHFYIRPKHKPKLSKFCQELTGITQSFLDKNGSKNTVQSVLTQWNEWCLKNDLCPQMINNTPVPNACVVTCGDWDLKTMWTQQQTTTNCSCPLLFHSWINIKHVFKANMHQISDRKNKYGAGMMGMLDYCEIKHVGRHHSGIDDVFNICKIAQKFLSLGVNFEYTTTNFRKRSIWNDIRNEQKQSQTDIKQVKQLKKQKFRYLVVLDFEATCDNPTNPNPQEIIEWPAMIIDTVTNKILNRQFHYYIRPAIHPKLTAFCTRLTGITQQIMDTKGAQNKIESVVSEWNDWCYTNGLLCADSNTPNACIVTHFDWDLRQCWTVQQSAAKCSEPVLFHSWIDICVPIYANLERFRCAANNYGSKKFKRGLKKLLGYLGIEHEGRHHSGIDDVRNICKIVQKCLEVGVVFDYTTQNYGRRNIQTDMICWKDKEQLKAKKSDENTKK